MYPSHQTLQRFPFCFWVKAKVLNMIPYNLVTLTSRTIVPTILSLTHCTQDTIGFLLALENSSPTLATRSLYFPFSLLGWLFLRYPYGVFIYLPPSSLTSNVAFSVRLSVTIHLKFQLVLSHIPTLIPTPYLYPRYILPCGIDICLLLCFDLFLCARI